MKKEKNIFGDSNTTYTGENRFNAIQDFNLFQKNRSSDKKKYTFFSPITKKNQTSLFKKFENNNNSNTNKTDINKYIGNLNPKNVIKKKNPLTESINLNILPDYQENSPLNDFLNNNNINNNINFNNNNNNAINRAGKKNNSQINKKLNYNNNFREDNINNKMKNNININININNNKNNPIQINNININNNNKSDCFKYIKDNIKINEDNNNDNNNTNNMNRAKNERRNLSQSVNSFNKTSNIINANTYNNSKKKNMKIKQSEEMKQKKKEEDEINRNQIRDNIKCYVCIDKIKNPRICKYCHRPACSECLRKWLNSKNQCGYCRRKIKFHETIEIPLLDEKFFEFFSKNVENKKEDNSDMNINNNNYDDIIYKSELISQNEEENNLKNICITHNKKLAYFCVQCNKKYCQKCLNILNDSAKIHKDHTILPIDKIKNNKKMIETLEEYNKLEETNTKLNDLINLCNLKKRELEIEKNNSIGQLDSIKEEIKAYLDYKLININSNYDKLKGKVHEINSAIDTTPIALMNIVKSNDYGQGDKIYEHIVNLNKINFEDSLLNLKYNKQNLFLENFISIPIEINIANEELFNKGEKIIINNQALNFISDFDCNLSITNHGITISIEINISKKENNNNNVSDISKFLCFAIIQKQKYACEFIYLKSIINEKEVILCGNINPKAFLSFKNENNKIIFRFYFMKYDYNYFLNE